MSNSRKKYRNLLCISILSNNVDVMIGWPVIVISISFFILIFFIHVFIWRKLKPKGHIKSIITLFIFIPITLLLLCELALFAFSFKIIPLVAFLLGLILYICAALVYILTYPAIQAWSPSLFIVNIIGNSKKVKSENEIRELLLSEGLISGRVDDLIADSLVIRDYDKNELCLTQKGRFIAKIFFLYRKFLGVEAGQG